MAWEPVLDGALADDALDALGDIARDIGIGVDASPRAEDIGRCWAYAGDTLGNDAGYHRAVAGLVRQVETGASSGIRLYGGVVGAAWTLAHVGDGDALVAIDDRLLDLVSIGP